MFRLQTTLCSSGAALLLASAAASAAPRYHEVSLDAVAGLQATAVAINNRNVVALQVFSAGTFFSILLDSKTGRVLYRSPAGDLVNALSDNGNAAGDARTGPWVLIDGERRAVPLAHAFGVNDRGEVVGFNGGFFPQAALFSSKDGTVTQLGTLGGIQSVAFAINSSGQVTGQADLAGLPGHESHAFRWERGVMEDLGTLGASPSLGKAIDEAGRVVGSSVTPDSVFHPFLAGKDGVMQDLGTLPNCSTSVGAGVNTRGEAVGTSSACTTVRSRAFVVSDGTMFDLNDLATTVDGILFSRAHAINERGSIVGEAFGLAPSGRGISRPFLLVRDGAD